MDTALPSLSCTYGHGRAPSAAPHITTVVPNPSETYPAGSIRLPNTTAFQGPRLHSRRVERGGDSPATGSLENLDPRLDPAHLAVARFPADWRPPGPLSGFCGIVRSEDEVTVVCAEAEFETGLLASEQPLAREHGWRRITFPGPLPWELVGFRADVASRLAGAQIPFTSLAGFTTDHVLVRAAQADLAVAVLEGREPPQQRPGTNP